MFRSRSGYMASAMVTRKISFRAQSDRMRSAAVSDLLFSSAA